MIPLLLAITAAPQATPDNESVRPPYSFLRQAEDWSQFRQGTEDGDPFDPIKHVDLTDDGSVWVSFGGRLEARYEGWKNFGFSGGGGGVSTEDGFIVSRALVHADLHVGRSFRAFVEGKTAQSTDRDLPGGRRPLDMDTLALQQAFVDLTLPAGEGSFRLRPGRQMLLFGAQRLVSPLPWGNTLRTWDGLTAEWRTEDWSVTGIATAFVPVDKTEPNEVDRDTTLYGIYAARKPVDGGRGLDVYALGNERSDVTVNGTSGDERRTTIGARSHGAIAEQFDLEVESAWQFGDVGPGQVSAWFVAAEAGWRPEGLAGAPRFWVGLDAASGDDEAGGDVGTFHQLFPLGHAYLGYADLLGRQNSFDLSAGGTWRIATGTTLSVDLHHLRVLETSDALYNAGGRPIRTGFTSSEVGNEVDFLVRSNIDRHTRVYAGYTHVFAGRAIEQSGPSEDVDFLYIGAAYSF